MQRYFNRVEKQNKTDYNFFKMLHKIKSLKRKIRNMLHSEKFVQLLLIYIYNIMLNFVAIVNNNQKT